MKTSEEQNSGAYFFNQAHVSEIREVCSPLFKNFNLTHFGYLRYRADGGYLAVSSDINWAETHLKNDYASSPYFLEEVCSMPDNMYRASLWPTSHSADSTLEALYQHNIWHGLNIVQTSSDFTDVYYFASSRENHQVTSLYLNNSDLIKRFIVFFRDNTKNIFEKANIDEYAYSENYKAIMQRKKANELRVNQGVYPYKDNIENFVKETKLKKFEIAGSRSLSSREFQCLSLLSNGRTMKEIGKHLGLSPRTIESYINSIKNKLGCINKSEVIRIFEKSDLKDLILGV